MDVVDRGSAVTVFAFASPLGTVGKIPYGFEFSSTLKRSGAACNFVFFRDLRRAFYHATPEGNAGGLDFFADEIRGAIAALGSTYHVAIGLSMGGAAALYLGARCGFEQVIAFSPVFPLAEFSGERSWVRRLFHLPSLVSSPGGYATNISLAYVTRQLYRNAVSYVGKDGITSLAGPYLAGGDHPEVTIYYGTGCPMDHEHSLLLADCEHVEIIPLRTWDHNTAGFLKRRGKLVSAIFEPIEERQAVGFSETRRLARRRPR